MNKLTERVMAHYGGSIYDGQFLEQLFDSALQLLDQHKQQDEEIPTNESLLGKYNKKTLGQLINILRKRIDIEPSEVNKLEHALETRNHLVHGYFRNYEQLIATLTDDRVDEVVSDIEERREIIKVGHRILEAILDRLLARYGLSVESLKEDAERNIEQQSNQ